MPLADHFPVIDDRRFADILDEARARIPRYTPEWTDHNDSDLGITMIELFAWLTEMQIFRMSQVPELNYLKFLELIGIELNPAEPATGRVAFPLKQTFPEPSIIVPRRTRVSPEETDAEGRPIIFETDRSLIAIRAQLLNLQAFDGAGYRDFSVQNEDPGTAFHAFGPRASEGDALLLGFDAELPETDIQLTAWVPSESSGLAVQSCDAARTFFSSELTWEYWSQEREWLPLDVLKDETGAFNRSGEIHLRGPAGGEMLKAALGNVADERFWIRARITRADYERAPEVLAIRTNTVTVTQAETVEFETVGGSDGTIGQTARLHRAPIVAGTLELEIDEGSGYQAWTEVADFFGSGADDPHYVLNRSIGEIRFGDGRRGRVPVANPRNPSNFRARVYRVGGGTRGNLAAGSVVALKSGVDGVDADGVSNLFATTAGRDEETLEEARQRAPQALRSRDRAVTSEDFEYLARQAGNIARAKALPLHHPEFPGVEVPGVVTVIVVPDVPTGDVPRPMPSEGTLKTVCAYLNERRLLTTELFVIGPSYQEVKIRTELVVEDSADLGEVKSAALDAIERYFDPLQGGEDSSASEPGSGWPFGGDIFYSLVFRRLLLDGVLRIDSLTICLDDEEYPPCSDVSVPAGVLLANGGHEIEVRYDDE